jgi:hypothetical protein
MQVTGQLHRPEAESVLGRSEVLWAGFPRNVAVPFLALAPKRLGAE